MDFSKEFDECIRCLPDKLYNVLINCNSEIKNGTYEIRLRCNKPVMLYGIYGNFFLSSKGIPISRYGENCFCITENDMKFIMGKICEYSVYSKKNEINNGYITYGDKNRVGLCGTAYYRNNVVYTVTDFTSVNIRIAKNIKGCSDEIFGGYFTDCRESYIISGPPCSGKTTILRDLGRNLSLSDKLKYPKTVIIDERFEFNDDFESVGLCDVLKGYKKYDAISIAVRSLSPDIIIIDEIATADEAMKVAELQNCGVKFICSVHASDVLELKNKKVLKILLNEGDFCGVIMLDNGINTGKTKCFYECGELK